MKSASSGLLPLTQQPESYGRHVPARPAWCDENRTAVARPSLPRKRAPHHIKRDAGTESPASLASAYSILSSGTTIVPGMVAHRQATTCLGTDVHVRGVFPQAARPHIHRRHRRRVGLLVCGRDVRLTHHVGCEGTIVTSQSPQTATASSLSSKSSSLSTPMSWALFAQLSRTRSTNGAKALGSVKVTDSVKSISTDLISWRLTAPMNAS